MLSNDSARLVALVDATTEQPPYRLGTVLSRWRSRTEAAIADLDYRSGEFHARTRIVELVRPLPDGSPVDPRIDVAPMV
jgi:hypothetical protein